MTERDVRPVKSRLILNSFDEEFGLLRLPRFKRLNGCLVVQGTLGNEVVVG